MPLIKLSPAERRRVSAFISCLVLAMVAWVFAVLSNPHNFTISKVIIYKNAPQKRAFHSLQNDTVKATIQGNGWQMLFSRFNNHDKTVSVDLRSLERRNFVVMSTQLRQINLKQPVNRQIISFDPDTLYFDFSTRTVKKVPVRLIKAIKYEQQYAQSGDITIKPDYVTVSGPAEAISKITSWQTDTLKVDKLKETAVTQLALQNVKEVNMSVYPKSVQITLPVDEFTEKVVQVPVKVINNKNYHNVKLYPQKVKVTFVTSLSNYPVIDEGFFEATADLALWEKGYTVLPVKLRRIPPYCRIVKIEPSTLDFIIKK